MLADGNTVGILGVIVGVCGVLWGVYEHVCRKREKERDREEKKREQGTVNVRTIIRPKADAPDPQGKHQPNWIRIQATRKGIRDVTLSELWASVDGGKPVELRNPLLSQPEKWPYPLNPDGAQVFVVYRLSSFLDRHKDVLPSKLPFSLRLALKSTTGEFYESENTVDVTEPD